MKTLFLAMAVAVLAGCQPVVQQLVNPAAPEMTTRRATAMTGPLLQIQIPSRGAKAPLARAAVNGDVETWMAVDNISVSFRRGVLVASRGLGFDLMGADAQGTLDALAGYDAGVYRRQLRYLTGDHHSTYLMAGCSMVAAGAETVAGRQLQRFEETCQARQHSFTNIFWLEAGGGIVQSKQWLSPDVGFLITSRLR